MSTVVVYLLLLAAWSLVAFVFLAVGYRRPFFHWALIVYVSASLVLAVIVSIVNWGPPA